MRGAACVARSLLAGMLAGTLAGMLAGCAAPAVLTSSPAAGECPSSLRTGIRLTASVAQVAAPDGIEAPSGRVRLIAGVGRRILLSVEVPESVPRVRLLDSALTVFTYGGTLAGWARIVEPPGAGARESLQVSDGYLRLSPFLPGSHLHTGTQAIDVLVIPGGAPVSGLALRPGQMWNEAGRPIAPDDLEITLDPIEHMTAFTVVDATARFDFTVLERTRAPERWKCSVESHFQLVDHHSTLPNLWMLQHRARVGSKHDTLALYRPSVGTLPMVFLDLATAEGFAKWLSETHARRVGRYAIGVIAREKTTGFEPASDEDLGALAVVQYGSD